MWLLVEDDSDIRMVVAMMMTVWGENPLPFPDGKTAWAWLDSVESGAFSGPLPELALMDIRMPGYTGDQLAARMRSIESLKDIPIILMTAFSMSEGEISALRERCGVDHLLEKPLPDLDVFRALLYKVRDERRENHTPVPAETAIQSQASPDSRPATPAIRPDPRAEPEAQPQPVPAQNGAPGAMSEPPVPEAADAPAPPQALTPPQTHS
jgi:CheY-like chemotaxis protein